MSVSVLDTTAAFRHSLTSPSNPVVIEGYNVFGKVLEQNTILESIIELTTQCMHETENCENVKLESQIGRIVSKTQNQNILLPVETETVLIKDSSKIAFVPDIVRSNLDALYMGAFANVSSHYKIYPDVDYLELDIVYSSLEKKGANELLEGFHHCRTFRIPYVPNEKLTWEKLTMWACRNYGSLLIYKPQSQYHQKLDLNVWIQSNEEEVHFGIILKLRFRWHKIYKCCSIGNVSTGKFQVEIITQWDTTPNDKSFNMPVDTIYKQLFNTLIARKSPVSKDTSKQWMDLESVEESRKDWVQVATSGDQLARQYRRMADAKPNRFAYLLAMLHANVGSIIHCLNSLHEDDTDFTKFYYPGKFGDVAESAQIHYDTRKLVRQHGSAIEALRRSNNLVKRILIAAYIKHRSTVLDLACGHAQDMDKYATVGIRRLVGIDISQKEIQEARNRYHSRRSRFRYPAEFHHGNILEQKSFSFLRNRLFDVVSVQLAIHYMLESEATAHALLTQIYKALADGGRFIGSTVCCNALAHGIVAAKKEDEKCMSFGNDIFTVTLDPTTCPTLVGRRMDLHAVQNSFATRWGQKYHFYLMESINESEYIVPWQSFLRVCRDVGFRLEFDCSFPELLNLAPDLIRKLQLSPSVAENVSSHLSNIGAYPLSRAQSEAFGLYRVFVFEKISARCKMLLGGVKILKE